MRIINKPIDKEYMHFFVCFLETLNLASCQSRDWRARCVLESVHYLFGDIIDNFLKTEEIPKEFISSEYRKNDNTGIQLPPYCTWVSKSGRFSCHWLHYLLGYQSYILWDNKRKVVMPVLFHDLFGIDEKSGVIFCRTIGDFHAAQCDSPLRINLEWIDMPQYYDSFPSDYVTKYSNELNNDKLEDIFSKDTIRIDINFDELSVRMPEFDEVLKENLDLLINSKQTNEEEYKLTELILNHPDICRRQDFDVEDLSIAIYAKTSNKKIHDKIIDKIFPKKEDLPF